MQQLGATIKTVMLNRCLSWNRVSLLILRTSVYCNYFIEQIAGIFLQRNGKHNEFFNADPISPVFNIVKMPKRNPIL